MLRQEKPQVQDSIWNIRSILSFLVLSLLGPILSLQAETLVVDAHGALPSIAQAIASAKSGDTIEVRAGLYSGNLVVDKPVTLVGSDRPVIHGDGSGSVITALAPCAIRGFIVEHSGNMLVDEDSGILLKSDNNEIADNELRDVLFGIYLYASAGNRIDGNIIRSRPQLDLGERGNGIHIWNAKRNTILNNTVSDARDGMYLQNASESTIQGNHIHGLRYGLHYMYSDNNVFEDNIFDHNVAGAAIMYSKNIKFRRNAFIHNRGFSSFGILFQGTEGCLAEDNIIADNAVGLFLEAHSHSVFRRNLVAGNDVALEMFSSADGNTFEANNFIDNLSPLQIVGKSTTTRWNGESLGNYWSEYDGYDLDGDGIGDLPFKIQNVFEHLEGNFPRLRIYLMSPASQALAFAENGFPVIQGSKEYDQRPLLRPVPLTFNLGQLEQPRPAPWGAFFLPLAMLVFPIFVFGAGRRR